jgi:hypothetical protein
VLTEGHIADLKEREEGSETGLYENGNKRGLLNCFGARNSVSGAALPAIILVMPARRCKGLALLLVHLSGRVVCSISGSGNGADGVSVLSRTVI